MIVSGWAVAALFSSLFTAVIALVIERAKLKPVHQLLWMRIFVIIVLSGLPFVLAWPVQPLYYLFVVIASLMFAYTDLFVFGAIARSGAAVVTRLEPLGVIGTFFIWTAITPALALAYLHNPLRGIGILCCLVAAVYFVLRLRRCPISLGALKIMAVPIALSALGIVFSKMAMEQAGNLHSGVYYYPLVQALTVVSVYILMMRIGCLKRFLPDFEYHSRLFDKKVIGTGMIVAVFHLGASISKYYGISLAANPAYVTMVILAAPLWIMLFYALTGRREQSDVVSGLGVLAAIMALVILTGL